MRPKRKGKSKKSCSSDDTDFCFLPTIIICRCIIWIDYLVTIFSTCFRRYQVKRYQIRKTKTQIMLYKGFRRQPSFLCSEARQSINEMSHMEENCSNSLSIILLEDFNYILSIAYEIWSERSACNQRSKLR